MVPSFLLLDVVSTPYDEVNKTSPTSSPDVTHSQGSKIVHFVDQLEKNFTDTDARYLFLCKSKGRKHGGVWGTHTGCGGLFVQHWHRLSEVAEMGAVAVSGSSTKN